MCDRCNSEPTLGERLTEAGVFRDEDGGHTYTNDHLTGGAFHSTEEWDCACEATVDDFGHHVPAENGTCAYCAMSEWCETAREAGPLGGDWIFNSWDDEPWFYSVWTFIRNMFCRATEDTPNFFTMTRGLWGEQLWALDSIGEDRDYKDWVWLE